MFNFINFDIFAFPIASSGRILSYALRPIHRWLESLEVHEPEFARVLCQSIPAHCLFERDVCLFGRTLFHIPALCKLNPFYDRLMQLRFRALCFLADECGEDVSAYCR